MREFSATAVAADEITENDVYMLVMAENSDGTGMRLEVQKGLSFDKQDASLGMDTYCLCTETGACHYGGILKWSYSDHSLEISIDSEAAKVLDAEGGFRVKISPPQEHIVRAALRRLLGAEFG